MIPSGPGIPAAGRQPYDTHMTDNPDPMPRPPRDAMRMILPAVMLTAIIAAAPATPVVQDDAIRKALTFHAPFDGSPNARFAAGDATLYWAPSMKQRAEARPGLPDGPTIQLAPGTGRAGGALRFNARKAPVVFFKGARNMPFAARDWSGTVSFWLSVDPGGELEPGFCDPVQITPRAWNDAAFFVEFERRPESIPFRLGVYADLAVWNPAGRAFADIPAAERPLVTVDPPPFERGKWTHVAFTFEHFNSGRPDGVARLYLDGRARGALSPRLQTFTWDVEQAAIALGLGYIGLIDELAIFNRALSEAEVRALSMLPSLAGARNGEAPPAANGLRP